MVTLRNLILVSIELRCVMYALVRVVLVGRFDA
jgi:hypothetical protein